MTTPSLIPEALARAAQTGFGGYIDRDVDYTLADVEAASARLATAFLDMGLKRGDRLALIALNQIEWLQAFFAATRIGIVVVAPSVRYRRAELDYMLNDAAVTAVVCLPALDGFSFQALFDEMKAELPRVERFIYLGDDFDRLLATPADPARLAAAEVQSDDLAMVIYTSGTTGRPKGAGLTHGSLLRSAAAQAMHTRMGPGDHLKVAMPFNHVGGITCSILAALLSGASCELVPVFRADTIIAMATRRPPTMLTGVPTMLTLLLMNPGFAEIDRQRVRLVIVGGSNVEPALLTRLREALPNAAMMNLYGLSETSGAIVMTPENATAEQVLGPLGRPLPGASLRIVGSAGEVPVGEIGELRFKGVGVIPGYIGAAAGDQPFDADGWLRTGDLGYVDGDGLIHLMGRAKEMYIQGGYNVYPAEVENLIARLPGGRGAGALPAKPRRLQAAAPDRVSARPAADPGRQGAESGAARGSP
jgi:fatty-acyl-CoA synthase